MMTDKAEVDAIITLAGKFAKPEQESEESLFSALVKRKAERITLAHSA